MANLLRNNPIWCDTDSSTIISSEEGVLVQGIQWIDDFNADIADTNTIVMSINGVPISMIITDVNTQMSGAIAYEIIFPQPIRVFSLILTTLDNGALLVWKA